MTPASSAEGTGRSAEATGRSIEEAVARALEALGAARAEVDVEVLQEPRPALLGFGGREARVRVTRRPDVAAVAQAFLEGVLVRMGLAADVHVVATADGVDGTMEGPDADRLAAGEGELLDALEVILGAHLQRQFARRLAVRIDAAGLRGRQEQALVARARSAAERAVREGTPVALEPMDPRARRIVHLALRDDERVTTGSEGEDDHRHVVVSPKSPARSPEGSTVPDPG